MKVETKSATIENTGADDAFPGSFSVVLSTATKDRDGEEVKRAEWQEPLPEHITFDVDHGMSVEKTIGSGKPYFDDQDRLVVDGTYSSLPAAQKVRTLVNEGHVRTVSVAFARHSSTDDKTGAKTTTRELLNGAFVAIPANTEAVVLASKSGARNSSADQKNLQAAHDAIVAVGAQCPPMDDTGAAEGVTGGKSATDVATKAKYTAEELREMLDKGEAFKNPEGEPSYPIADQEDLENAIHAVGRGSGDHDEIRAYITHRASALGLTKLLPDDWKSANGVFVGKDFGPNDYVSVSVSGSVGGFNVSVDAWCIPADQLDAYADSAQRALSAALQIASGGPVNDDGDEAGDSELKGRTAASDEVDVVALTATAKTLDIESWAAAVE